MAEWAATPASNAGRQPAAPSRRRFLAGSAAVAGAAAAAGLATGCGAAGLLGLGRSVRIALPWSDQELKAFHAVLTELGRGNDVELLPLGDDISTAFGPRTSRRPDIIMLPQPGLVTDHKDRLAELPAQLTSPWPYADVWDDALRHDCDSRQRYGLPFKMANLSTVWYRKSVFEAHHLETPRKWSDWLDVNSALRGANVPPLAIAAGDGWTLAHTFQNVLQGCSPETYKLLTNVPRQWKHYRVLQALTLLGGMWAPDDTLAGGVDASLVQQFPDAVVEVFAYKRAAMVVAPDFAESVIRQFASDPNDVGVFPFPVVDGDGHGIVTEQVQRPVVVGGDIAVLPQPASTEALDLVGKLASAQAPLQWIRTYGGFIAANQNTPVSAYSDALRPLAQVAQPLAPDPPPPGELPPLPTVFGLADQLGALGGRDGLWRVLQDFLAAVGRGTAVPEAAWTAAKRLNDLDRREAGPRCR
jgi:alpha-glucoside transport system substrate-binding protein